MRSFDWKAGLPFALALAATVAIPQDAFAQFFFRPFANIFRTQSPSEGPPAFASRPAVASILGRTGFQLVGPLGRRGDQIVATGVSRREGEMRFIIDPYAGRILRAVRLGTPPRRAAPDAPPIAGGPGPAGPGFDNARVPEAAQAGARLNGAPNGPAQQRAATAKVGASSKSSRAIVPPPATPAATQKASEPSPGPAAQADKPPSESPAPAKATHDAPADAKNLPPSPIPAETSASPGVAPAANAAKQAADKPASGSTETQAESAGSTAASGAAPSRAAQESKQEADGVAAPPASAPAEKAADTGAPLTQSPTTASAERSAPAKRAAAARAAGLSRRAIVPPHASSGTTVVTPAASAPPAPTPSGAATAKTPDDAKPTGG